VLYRVRPDGQVFMKAEFDSIRDRVSGVVMDSMFETVGLVARILTASRAADKALKGATSMALLAALTDAREQLNGLVYPGFVSATGLAQLRHLPRYLGGISARIEKLKDNPNRDRVWMNEVQAATTRFVDAGGRIPLDDRGTAHQPLRPGAACRGERLPAAHPKGSRELEPVNSSAMRSHEQHKRSFEGNDVLQGWD
jgi:ATP-dependent helicase HrpA